MLRSLHAMLSGQCAAPVIIPKRPRASESHKRDLRIHNNHHNLAKAAALGHKQYTPRMLSLCVLHASLLEISLIQTDLQPALGAARQVCRCPSLNFLSDVRV